MEPLDKIFDVLSEERRRYALYYLGNQNGPVSVDEVAAQVAEWEANGAPATVPEEKFVDVRLDLYHVDLPKASEVEYVQYDPEEGVVEVTETSPEFDVITSVAEIIERPERNP